MAIQFQGDIQASQFDKQLKQKNRSPPFATRAKEEIGSKFVIANLVGKLNLQISATFRKAQL